jgi:hypothetical protein
MWKDERVPLTPSTTQIRRLVEGLEAAGFRVALGDPTARPVEIEIVKDDQAAVLRVFSWNVTPGGATRSPTERRVQATRPGNAPLYVPDGPPTLLLGYDVGLDVFAAWDASMHQDPSPSPSLQVPLATLEEAAQEGFAAYARDVAEGREVVVAFRPENVDAYLAVAPVLAETREEDIAVTAAAASGEDLATEDLPTLPERRRAIRTVSVAVRDVRFRTRVLDAYSGRCAFCGLNVGLAEAGHLRPVHDDGTDSITNGIAACPTHHKALDGGLILIGDDWAISVNTGLLAELGATEADRVALAVSLQSHLTLPATTGLRPSQDEVSYHRSFWAR